MTTIDPARPTPGSDMYTTPGWYPDPVTDGKSDRWWTGESWSGHSRPRTAAVLAPPAPVPATWPTTKPRNGTAWYALALGVGASLIAGYSLFNPTHVWVSTIGVVAVVVGIRALRLRAAGGATAFVPAVAAIVLGALASLVMLVSFALPGPSSVSSYGSAVEQSAPLDAVASQPLPDDALASYTSIPVQSIVARDTACGGLRQNPVAVPGSTYARTAARERQDELSAQVDGVRAVLTRSTGTAASWPDAIAVDPTTRTVFTPAPGCAALGVLPEGAELRYGRSPDGSQVAVAMWDPAMRLGTVWRSVDDTGYQL